MYFCCSVLVWFGPIQNPKGSTVCVKKSPHLDVFWHFFQRLGILSPNFTYFLYVPIYDRLQIFIQLSAILMKLCHMFIYIRPICTLAFSNIFAKQLGFLVRSLHIYYTFLSTLDYKFLSNYFQLWRSYAILSATTQRAFQPMVDILSI